MGAGSAGGGDTSGGGGRTGGTRPGGAGGGTSDGGVRGRLRLASQPVLAPGFPPLDSPLGNPHSWSLWLTWRQPHPPRCESGLTAPAWPAGPLRSHGHRLDKEHVPQSAHDGRPWDLHCHIRKGDSLCPPEPFAKACGWKMAGEPREGQDAHGEQAHGGKRRSRAGRRWPGHRRP